MLAWSTSSMAQQFDVPEGFVVSPEADTAISEDWEPLTAVRPVEGPFSKLSTISLRAVRGDVTDPDAWLAANGTEGAAVVRVPGLANTENPFDALHPSLTATATALAVGILANEVAPAALGLEEVGDAISLVTRSRFGDVTVIHIEAP